MQFYRFLAVVYFLKFRTEAVREKVPSAIDEIQRRESSDKCSDTTPLLNKLINEIEEMKGQILHEMPEQLAMQAEEIKKLRDDVKGIDKDVKGIENDVNGIRNDVKGIDKLDMKMKDGFRDVREELKEAIIQEITKSANRSNSACINNPYLRKIESSVENVADRTKKISENLQTHDQRLQDLADVISFEGNLALGRPATQSSTYPTLEASKAVDGDYSNDQSVGALSCSATNDGSGGPNWWRVKLDRPYRVQKVIVRNRKNCCPDRLDYFIVGVTNSTAVPVRGTYPLCGRYPRKTASDATLTLYCNPNIGAGQYVIIQQPINGPGWLTLCEVEVYARAVRN